MPPYFLWSPPPNFIAAFIVFPVMNSGWPQLESVWIPNVLPWINFTPWVNVFLIRARLSCVHVSPLPPSDDRKNSRDKLISYHQPQWEPHRFEFQISNFLNAFCRINQGWICNVLLAQPSSRKCKMINELFNQISKFHYAQPDLLENSFSLFH